MWIVVFTLSFFISILNILRVLIGYFQTPKGYTYLGVGHYYQDYFEYTQQIAQGIFGHWLVQNQFTTHDPTRTLIGWGQYIFIGKLALLFHLSPFSIYWITTFLLSIPLCMLTFLVIKKMLPAVSFFQKISAFLFCLFAAPFITFVQTNGQWHTVPYNFWYAPISLFHRIGGIPHHLLTTVIILLSILLMDKLLTRLQTRPLRTAIPPMLFLITLLLLLVTFGPLQVINILMSFGVVSVILMIRSIQKKQNTQAKRVLFFLLIVAFSITPFALFIQHSHSSGELFQWVTAWEVAQQHYPALPLVLLTIGPILLLFPFGIWSYIRSATPVRLLVLFMTFWSYLFAATPLAKYLGTFNLRFLSPVSYMLFAVVGILGIRTIAKKFRKKIIITITLISGFLLYFIVVTLVILRSFGTVDPISYQPTALLDGIKHLTVYPDTRAVLTSPAASLGMITPCLVDRNVYLGRMFFTPKYEEKITISEQFYQGRMTSNQALQFLIENNIGYVLLSSTEPYSAENFQHYPFLRELMKNSALTIYAFQ